MPGLTGYGGGDGPVPIENDVMAGPDGQPECSLRLAGPADRAALHRLFFDSWIAFWAPHLPPAAEVRFRAEDPVARFLDSSLGKIEVAECDGCIAGAILVENARLEDLHVARRFQGRGIGRLLLRRAEELGARRLEVRAFNARAIRFYERAGWVRRRTCETTELGFPVLSHEYAAPSEAERVAP